MSMREEDIQSALEGIGNQGQRLRQEVDVNVSSSVLEDAVNALPSTTDSFTEYNVTCTLADTEYSQELPSSTRSISVQVRNYGTGRFCFTEGKVAGSVSPYFTLHSGQTYSNDNLKLTGTTIYLASSTAGDVFEIIAGT